MISIIVRYLTLLGMLAIVAWFFWNPNGWTFLWEPIVVFIFALAGFIGSEVSIYKRRGNKLENLVHQNDVTLFRKFIELIPSGGPIKFLREHDFLSPFDIETLKPFRTFYHDWDNAEHEYLDCELEQLRLNLYKAVKKFNSSIGQYTSPNSMGYQAVRSDGVGYSKAYEERIREEANIINAAADEVIKTHQKLVGCGRKKLDLS